jgi:hypothetical protein
VYIPPDGGSVNTLLIVIAATLVLALSSGYASLRYRQHQRPLELITGMLLLVSFGMLSCRLHLFC